MSEHTKRPEKCDQMALALWAADCAEHVLIFFEKKYPKDKRPRKAIDLCRAWVSGEVKFTAIRAAALASHAAARETTDAAARAAARAAGQAVATAHVAGHARAAADYAVKAAANAGVSEAEERDWQRRRLPKHLWPIALPPKKTHPHAD